MEILCYKPWERSCWWNWWQRWGLVWAKVISKGGDRIIFQSSNDFPKAAEQLLNKTEVIHISQEEISSRTSEVIDWSLVKSLSLGLCKNNIHIHNDVYKVQEFKHYGSKKVAELSYKTDESVKLTTGGFILFTVIFLILFS